MSGVAKHVLFNKLRPSPSACGAYQAQGQNRFPNKLKNAKTDNCRVGQLRNYPLRNRPGSEALGQ